MRITIGQVQIEVDDHGIVGDVRIAKPLIDRPGEPKSFARQAGKTVAMALGDDETIRDEIQNGSGFRELEHRRQWTSTAVTFLRVLRKKLEERQELHLMTKEGPDWVDELEHIATLLKTQSPDD